MKLAIYYEQKDGKDTGRVEVVDEDDELVLETCDTEPEAKKAMARLQAEHDRDEQIEKEYLEWEKVCLSCHTITKEELRTFLVNAVIL